MSDHCDPDDRPVLSIPSPPPSWWRDENAAYVNAMITRMLGIFSVAGFIAGAVWLGLQQ